MFKQWMVTVVLGMLALGALLAGCGNGEAEKQREAQINAQLQKVDQQVAANNQAIAAIETRLQMLEEDFNDNVAKIKAEIAKSKQSTQTLSGAVSDVKTAEQQAAAEKSKGVIPGWLEFILILAIIVAALLLLLYLLRPKPVEDEDFEDFEDMEDFEMDEGEGDDGDGGKKD